MEDREVTTANFDEALESFGKDLKIFSQNAVHSPDEWKGIYLKYLPIINCCKGTQINGQQRTSLREHSLQLIDLRINESAINTGSTEESQIVKTDIESQAKIIYRDLKTLVRMGIFDLNDVEGFVTKMTEKKLITNANDLEVTPKGAQGYSISPDFFKQVLQLRKLGFINAQELTPQQDDLNFTSQACLYNLNGEKVFQTDIDTQGLVNLIQSTDFPIIILDRFDGYQNFLQHLGRDYLHDVLVINEQAEATPGMEYVTTKAMSLIIPIEVEKTTGIKAGKYVIIHEWDRSQPEKPVQPQDIYHNGVPLAMISEDRFRNIVSTRELEI